MVAPTTPEFANLSVKDLKSFLQTAQAEIPKDSSSIFLCFCELINRASNDAPLLEDFGEFLLDAHSLVGEVFDDETALREAARSVLIRSVELEPASSSKKYMYLGQISEGEESLRWYQTGRELLKPRLSPAGAAEDVTRYCDFSAAIAELHMTDLCDNPEAQEVIEDVLQEAVTLCPGHFDVRVQRAAYALVIKDSEESVKEAQQALNILFPLISSLGALEDRRMEEDNEVDVDLELPNLDVQLQLARICTDNGLVDDAIKVLEFLLRQDEEDDRIWHRLALAYYVKKEYSSSLEAAQTALALVEEDDGASPSEEGESRTDALNELIKDLEQHVTTAKNFSCT